MYNYTKYGFPLILNFGILRDLDKVLRTIHKFFKEEVVRKPFLTLMKIKGTHVNLFRTFIYNRVN